MRGVQIFIHELWKNGKNITSGEYRENAKWFRFGCWLLTTVINYTKKRICWLWWIFVSVCFLSFFLEQSRALCNEIQADSTHKQAHTCYRLILKFRKRMLKTNGAVFYWRTLSFIHSKKKNEIKVIIIIIHIMNMP